MRETNDTKSYCPYSLTWKRFSPQMHLEDSLRQRESFTSPQDLVAQTTNSPSCRHNSSTWKQPVKHQVSAVSFQTSLKNILKSSNCRTTFNSTEMLQLNTKEPLNHLWQKNLLRVQASVLSLILYKSTWALILPDSPINHCRSIISRHVCCICCSANVFAFPAT